MEKVNASGIHQAWIVLMIAVFLGFVPRTSAQHRITGTVVDSISVHPLAGAHIYLEHEGRGAVTDADGRFLLESAPGGLTSIKVSFVGYRTRKVILQLITDTVIAVKLMQLPVLGDEVNILATRVRDNYPAAYTTIKQRDISKVNLGSDMPYLIQNTPSALVTSDAGNGVGYTGISIRGTDLTRINVTFNGIPLNDAESQGVWFVDLPDLSSSTEDLQIQRGVGTSTNGAGAFGASINIRGSGLRQDPYGELDLSGGSFNTLKTTLRFGTGLVASRICVDGRLSYIHSDGYIDRAFSNLKSYYLSAGYYGKSTTIRLITFAGFEKTYQAWEGVPKDSLSTNRTYNPAGEYRNSDGSTGYYDNQTDNYQQYHYQLLVSQVITKGLDVNAALHYTKGSGYYENFRQDEPFSDYGLNDVIIGSDTILTTNLVNRKMMDNDFYGVTFSGNYSLENKLTVTLGGAWNRYDGRHYGKVIWAQYASNGDNERNWYYNTGRKTDFNIFSKVTITPVKVLSIFTDLQYRRVLYRMEGTLDDQRELDQNHTFDFFNPKCGVLANFNNRHEWFLYFGIANREPSRNNYKDADPDRLPSAERLYDYELGYSLKYPDFSIRANLFYMNYRNQLVLTGEINNVGEAVMVNVPHSYRTGIELSAGAGFFRKKLNWNVSATFSSSKIKDFTKYTDTYDASGEFTGQRSEYLGTTDLSFSPSILVLSDISITPVRDLTFSLLSRYAGRQYIDNTGDPERSLHDYFVNSLTASYALRDLGVLREISFNLAVNNLFSVKYETNAWVYPYYYDNEYYEANGYFPQALIHFLFGISLKI